MSVDATEVGNFSPQVNGKLPTFNPKKQVKKPKLTSSLRDSLSPRQGGKNQKLKPFTFGKSPVVLNKA